MNAALPASLLLLVGSSLACTGGEARPDGGNGLALSIEAEPFVVLGEAADDCAGAPGYVTGATRLPDGTIAVADLYLPGIRYFDSPGALLHTAGGAWGRTNSRPSNGSASARRIRCSSGTAGAA